MGSPTAPAGSSPNIINNRGYTGYTTRKPVEISRFDGAEPVTPADRVTGYRGYTGPNDGPDPFAGLTDTDRARDWAIRFGGGAGDDGELTMLPCLGEVPPPSFFRFGELPEPSSIWVYRTAEGAAVVVAARYDGTAADADRQRT
jgi:hypothetical protein